MILYFTIEPFLCCCKPYTYTTGCWRSPPVPPPLPPAMYTATTKTGLYASSGWNFRIWAYFLSRLMLHPPFCSSGSSPQTELEMQPLPHPHPHTRTDTLFLMSYILIFFLVQVVVERLAWKKSWKPPCFRWWGKKWSGNEQVHRPWSSCFWYSRQGVPALLSTSCNPLMQFTL